MKPFQLLWIFRPLGLSSLAHMVLKQNSKYWTKERETYSDRVKITQRLLIKHYMILTDRKTSSGFLSFIHIHCAHEKGFRVCYRCIFISFFFHSVFKWVPLYIHVTVDFLAKITVALLPVFICKIRITKHKCLSIQKKEKRNCNFLSTREYPFIL